MTMFGRTLNLNRELDRFPVSAADLDAVLEYDPRHADGRPWRYAHVYRARRDTLGVPTFRVRLHERAPWGESVIVDLHGRHPTDREAAKEIVRYWKWRYGDDDWRPRDDRPPDVEAFDDEVEPGQPPSWVGRVWQNGDPVLVFADVETEAGFASHDEALKAAQDLVRERMPKNWRRWLCRHPRPWVGPMPAGMLDPLLAPPAG